MMAILSQEMEGQAAHMGYKYSWHQLKLQSINVPKELVMKYKRIVDPVGVERRKVHFSKCRIYSSLGPNDC